MECEVLFLSLTLEQAYLMSCTFITQALLSLLHRQALTFDCCIICHEDEGHEK